MRHKKQWWSIALAILMFWMPAWVLADSSSSTNYRVDQTFFGSGGELNACSSGSTGYCSKQTAGELANGNTASSNFQAYAGFNTTDEPFLEFFVTATNIDLGYLSTSSASTGSGTFYVRAWQASGYVVRTESDPPTNTGNNYQLNALASPSASSPGTEQFGINLVANSSPAVGSDPVQVPDATFSSGIASSGYDTANQFKYVKGDIVAESPKSTSVTIYTISYLFNITDTTPSGEYVFRHVLVATGTY